MMARFEPDFCSIESELSPTVPLPLSYRWGLRSNFWTTSVSKICSNNSSVKRLSKLFMTFRKSCWRLHWRNDACIADVVVIVTFLCWHLLASKRRRRCFRHDVPRIQISFNDLLNAFNGTISASFCLFSSFSRYNVNNTNGKSIHGCAWDSNLRLHNGKRRQNYGAMVDALDFLNVLVKS